MHQPLQLHYITSEWRYTMDRRITLPRIVDGSIVYLPPLLPQRNLQNFFIRMYVYIVNMYFACFFLLNHLRKYQFFLWNSMWWLTGWRFQSEYQPWNKLLHKIYLKSLDLICTFAIVHRCRSIAESKLFLWEIQIKLSSHLNLSFTKKENLVL